MQTDNTHVFFTYTDIDVIRNHKGKTSTSKSLVARLVRIGVVQVVEEPLRGSHQHKVFKASIHDFFFHFVPRYSPSFENAYWQKYLGVPCPFNNNKTNIENKSLK